MVKKNPGTNNHHFRRLTKYVILNFVINDNILVLCSCLKDYTLFSFAMVEMHLSNSWSAETISRWKYLPWQDFNFMYFWQLKKLQYHSVLYLCLFVCLSMCPPKITKKNTNVSNKLGLSCAKLSLASASYTSYEKVRN